MKRFVFPSLFIVLALLLSSCSLGLGLSKTLGISAGATATKHIKATHTPPSPPQISITSSGFQPASLKVKNKTTVTWTNNAGAPEDIASDTVGQFDSGALAPGATFTYTFAQTGTFGFHSTSSPSTVGTVTVTK